MDEATDDRGSLCRYDLESKMSSKMGKSPGSREASGSNHAAESPSANPSGRKLICDCKGKTMTMNAREVKWLSDRLRTLEEEAEVMKRAFMESMEERKKMVNEIHQQFQVIGSYLRSRKQLTGDVSSDGILIFNPHENGRVGTGLAQVLHQQSNPSLVIRDLRATTVGAFEESTDR